MPATVEQPKKMTKTDENKGDWYEVLRGRHITEEWKDGVDEDGNKKRIRFNIRRYGPMQDDGPFLQSKEDLCKRFNSRDSIKFRKLDGPPSAEQLAQFNSASDEE